MKKFNSPPPIKSVNGKRGKQTKKGFFGKWFLLLLITVVLSYSANAQFTKGNLVVSQQGNGETLSLNGNVIVLQEYNTTVTSQSPIHSIVIPSTSVTPVTAANSPLIQLGLSTSEGAVSLSADGRYAIIPGYNAPLGTVSGSTRIDGTTGSSAPRGIGQIDGSGTYNLKASSSTILSGQAFKSATSDGNGNYWGVGAASGLSYFGNNTSAVAGVSTTGATSNRVATFINGNLYFATGTLGVYNAGALGSTALTTSGTTSTLTINKVATTFVDGYGFAINPAGTVAYVADNTSGILVFTNSGSGWAYQYTFKNTSKGSTVSGTPTVSGPHGIVVDFATSPATIYYTTPNGLYSVQDPGNGTNATTINTLATAPTGTALRGLCWTPNAQLLSKLTGGLANSTLTGNSTSQALYGFDLNSVGTGIITNISFTTTNTSSSNFVNWYLYSSTSSSYSAATSTLIASSTGATPGITVGATSISVAIPSANQTLAQGDNYYFLVTDVSSSVSASTPSASIYLGTTGITGTGNFGVGSTNFAAGNLSISTYAFVAGGAPLLTITPNSATLTALNYNYGAGPSATQSFTVTGANLSNASSSITISSAGTDYLVSTDNVTFGTSASLSYTGTSLSSNNTVYVELAANKSVGNYNNETITISSSGASNATVTVSGSVSYVPPTIGIQPSTTTTAPVCQYTAGTTISVGSITTGTNDNTLTYQWYSNASNSNSGGTVISGATAASYTPSDSTAGTFYYYCSVTNSASLSTNSNPSGSVTVLPAPSLVLSVNRVVLYGNINDTFSVANSAGTSQSYQWTLKRSGVTSNITTGAGANTSTYIDNSSNFLNNDSINCFVTNTNGCYAAASGSVGILLPTPSKFTPGHLAVLRVGADYPVVNLTASATRLFIDEFSTTPSSYNPNQKTTPLRSIAMPYSVGSAYPQSPNYGITESGVATSEGFMNLSADGTQLLIPGYNSPECFTYPRL